MHGLSCTASGFAQSTLRWLAHPRLQPRTSVWDESEAQPRGTSPPALCTHCPRTQLTSECTVWMPWAHPGVTLLPTAWTLTGLWWLADWMGLTPCCWSEGRYGQPWNAANQNVSGLIPSCATTCMGGPKLVLYELALAQPGSVPEEEHGARGDRLPGCLSPAPRNTTTHCYGYTRFDSQLRASSGIAKSAPSDRRINPARAAHQQWLLPIQLFPCTPLPPSSTHCRTKSLSTVHTGKKHNYTHIRYLEPFIITF